MQSINNYIQQPPVSYLQTADLPTKYGYVNHYEASVEMVEVQDKDSRETRSSKPARFAIFHPMYINIGCVKGKLTCRTPALLASL